MQTGQTEQDGVDVVALQMAGELARMRFDQIRFGRAHERIMRVGDRADCPIGGQLVEAVDREDNIPIFLKAGAIEIDRDMADQQIARRRAGRDRMVIRIAAAKRDAAAHQEAGGGHDCDAPLRQRRPGHPWFRRELRALKCGKALCLRRRQIDQAHHPPILPEMRRPASYQTERMFLLYSYPRYPQAMPSGQGGWGMASPRVAG